MDQLRARLMHAAVRRGRVVRGLAALATLLAAACAGDAAARSTVGGGYASLDAALAGFREGLAPVDSLTGGSDSREALVRRFVAAVTTSDTADIRHMTMSRAEFAWLYYPTSPFTRPPTRQGAPIAWVLHMEGSTKGVTRVLRRFGGRPLRLAGHTCDAAPVVEGANRLWTGCRLRVALPTGETVEHRFFGAILERGGRFKIHSYANDF